jgi:hypothetical protein
MLNINEPWHARLVVCSLAPALWLVTWCLTFVNRLPIGRTFKAAVVGLVQATAILTTLILQQRLYISMTGIRIPANDNFFFAIFVSEVVISGIVVFLVALELRKKGLRTSLIRPIR